MHKRLRHKKVLVTAGPTWVAIDAVRVISNISTGLTGITIAKRAASEGADVTLLLGPVNIVHSPRSTVHGLKIKRFKYFDELKELIDKELKNRKYDILIHTAAVSDYKPVKPFGKKIKSSKTALKISLKPTIKLIDRIRRYAGDAFLVMFKLEAKRPAPELIDIAYKSMLCSKADLVVANNVEDVFENRHKACIIDLRKNVVITRTKKELADRLLNIIAEKLDE